MKDIKVKDKRLNKALKKMSIWPGVVLFIALVGITILILSMFIEVLIQYIGKEKASAFKDEAKYIGRVSN